MPCALRQPPSNPLPRRATGRAYLRGGVLHLDGRPLAVGRVVDVRVAPPGPATGLPPAGSTTARGHPPGRGGRVRRRRRAARRPGPGALVRRLPALVGRGDGLTPLGDDVLCGWLAAHRAAGVATPDVDAAVRALLPRTTLLSATLLDCALHGEVLPEFAAYLAALGTPAEPGRAAALAAVGHTSGAGLLHGARLALAALAHPTGAAA